MPLNLPRSHQCTCWNRLFSGRAISEQNLSEKTILNDLSKTSGDIQTWARAIGQNLNSLRKKWSRKKAIFQKSFSKWLEVRIYETEIFVNCGKDDAGNGTSKNLFQMWNFK